ncbi:hypothetical protein BT69DRAFT_1339674 [Atractiella rhizophila]|nr:hypothetical protein BT69DRAFT_1339674 [Atractiella rhizophila]
MGVDDDTAINLNIVATFVETSALPLSQATSETLTESAPKHLLVAVTSAESDFHLPIDADDEQYTSEDVQNSPRGDMLGHNSLGEEILFRLKRWENIGSQKAILELLHAVLPGAMVSNCIGRLAESPVETWLNGGGSNAVDDLRLVKDLKNTIVQGEYSTALQEKMLYQKTVPTPNKITNEKNPRIEQHQISPLHPPPDDNGFHPPQPSSSATLPAIEHTFSPINHKFSPPQSADHAPPPIDRVSPYIDHSFPPPANPSLLLPKQTHGDPQLVDTPESVLLVQTLDIRPGYVFYRGGRQKELV